MMDELMLAGLFFCLFACFLAHGPSPCLSTPWCVESRDVESGVISVFQYLYNGIDKAEVL